MGTDYRTIEGLRWRFGSLVYSRKTVVYNAGGSAHNCTSAADGLCDCENECYAKVPEKIWKAVGQMRDRQREMWLSTPADVYIKALRFMWDRYNVRRWRVNESGDLATQAEVDKLSLITDNVPQTVFTYTANWKLNYKNVPFRFKLSHKFDIEGSTGRAIVIKKPEDVPDGFLLCPKTIKKIRKCDEGCAVCFKMKHMDVAFVKHGHGRSK
jgi:hypothetical protein